MKRLSSRMWRSVIGLSLAMVISFAGITLLTDGGSSADSRPPDIEGILRPASIEDASNLAGFDIKEPLHLPDRFGRIGLVLFQEEDGFRSRLSYADPSREAPGFIEIDQTPGSVGIGGKQAQVGRYQGERAVYPPGPGKPFTTEVLFWSVDGIGYAVIGAHVGPINSELLSNMANSLQ